MTAHYSRVKNFCPRLRNFFALAIFLHAGIAAAQNLATNPGFETGNTSGWFGFGSPTISAVTAPVHSGTYSALVTNRTATYMGIAQGLQGVLATNVIYAVSVWVQLASGTGQTVQFTAQKVDGAGTAYAVIASATVSAGSWTQLTGSYALNTSGILTNLNFYLEVPSSANAAYYADDFSVTAPIATPTNGACAVVWTNVFQRIDGFGASSAWRSSWTAAQADMFFSTNTGIGLSFLRTRIAPGGTTIENSIMQLAAARGARVWSTPWSPQTSFKGANANGIISVNGGPLIGNAANYQAYANQLAGYVANVKNSYGVNLYALSIQNEPDTDTTNYESCVWTAQQYHDFVPYLSSALTASNVASTKIMLPESFRWSSNPLQNTALNDAAVAPLVGIIGNHNYDGATFNTGDTSPPAAVTNYGKALWETEVSTGDAFDGSIMNALYWAGRIHLFMTAAQANAWHFWWLVSFGNDNQGLTDASVNPAKRMYALGNFSRFVRPNFYRVGVANSGPLQISAYKDLTNGNFAIVVVNSNATAITQVFNLNGFATTNLTPWITSAMLSLSNQPPFAVSGAAFTNTIPALSIVTFVGQSVAGNSAPTNITLSASTLAENLPVSTLIGAFTTADPDAGNTFTYSLVSGTGSADNSSFTVSSSNLLSAASFNYEVQNSFSIRVRSTDQGGLFFEKAFTITVTNVNEPPVLAGVSNATIGAGAVLQITNTATDPDLPPQILTFSLLAAPVGATLNSSSGIFSWRPLVSQANTTNPVTVKVADNGTPVLSATNNFSVIVKPLVPPAMQSINLTASSVILSVTGALGPDYTLLTSTNLTGWQPLLTTNPTALPLTFTTTNQAELQRFYKVQISP